MHRYCIKTYTEKFLWMAKTLKTPKLCSFKNFPVYGISSNGIFKAQQSWVLKKEAVDA